MRDYILLTVTVNNQCSYPVNNGEQLPLIFLKEIQTGHVIVKTWRKVFSLKIMYCLKIEIWTLARKYMSYK